MRRRVCPGRKVGDRRVVRRVEAGSQVGGEVGGGKVACQGALGGEVGAGGADSDMAGEVEVEVRSGGGGLGMCIWRVWWWKLVFVLELRRFGEWNGNRNLLIMNVGIGRSIYIWGIMVLQFCGFGGLWVEEGPMPSLGRSVMALAGFDWLDG